MIAVDDNVLSSCSCLKAVLNFDFNESRLSLKFQLFRSILTDRRSMQIVLNFTRISIIKHWKFVDHKTVKVIRLQHRNPSSRFVNVLFEGSKDESFWLTFTTLASCGETNLYCHLISKHPEVTKFFVADYFIVRHMFILKRIEDFMVKFYS